MNFQKRNRITFLAFGWSHYVLRMFQDSFNDTKRIYILFTLFTVFLSLDKCSSIVKIAWRTMWFQSNIIKILPSYTSTIRSKIYVTRSKDSSFWLFLPHVINTYRAACHTLNSKYFLKTTRLFSLPSRNYFVKYRMKKNVPTHLNTSRVMINYYVNMPLNN